ncbi:MAG: peptide deformylase [Candidatus Paracaedibacteraceae bacterium]|nr:peptide deformylase [Candidatus Paracaedibacteraceae bacterium]
MTLLTVLTVPDSRLRIKAKPVSVFDEKLSILFDDMLETMYVEDGAGLAAPQVGIDLRVVVMDVSERENESCVYKMVNPEVTWRSKELSVCNEGCLSVPEQRAEISRPAAIKMHYLDENGVLQHIETDGFLATCIQHEMDHLDGKLYIDYLSTLKRQMYINKVKRIKKYESEN